MREGARRGFWGLATRSLAIRIGAYLVGLGLGLVIFVGFDAIKGRSSSSSQLWVAADLALIGGVLVAIGVRRGRARWRVLDEGLSTEATVTAVTERRFLGMVRLDAPSWVIRYRYQDNLGRSVQGRSWDLTPEEAENWEVGDTAMIRFDGRRTSTSAWIGSPPGSKRHAPRPMVPPPSWIRLAKRVPLFWIGPLFFIFGVMVLGAAGAQLHHSLPIVVSVIYLLPGLLLFLVGFRRVWIWHRLVGHGVRATGTVSAVKSALIEGDWGWGVSEWQRIIRYRYEDDGGHAHQGRSGYLSSAEASRWRVGDRCAIRFDRERPAGSVWIGALEGVSETH